MMHEAFIAAKRTEVDRLEALARDLLENHPPPNVWPKEGSAGEVVEIEWRELAHASRQLRPLLEALERANAREPGFESYRDGFDFRLTEAMATVARLCAHGRLNSIGQREKATRPRPGGKSPFTRVIEDYLRRFPGASSEDVTRALEAAERNGADFYLSPDRTTFISSDGRHHLQISSIPATLYKLRTKVLKG
jgi:hypothetical protein